jgi:hypothetical protein
MDKNFFHYGRQPQKCNVDNCSRRKSSSVGMWFRPGSVDSNSDMTSQPPSGHHGFARFLWNLMKNCEPIVRGLRRAGFTGGWL